MAGRGVAPAAGSTAPSVFERDGDAVVATEYARGPWDDGSCHGGATAALLATLAETMPSAVPMQTVRLTYDLVRPVPIRTPLSAAVEVVRDGQRVQGIAGSLSANGTQLVRLTALRIRTAEVEVPAEATEDDRPPEPGPDAVGRFEGGDIRWDVGFHVAMDIRMTAGGLGGGQRRGTAWFRPDVPLLADTDWTPTAHAAAVADFGNGIGAPLSWDTHLFVNPDLTLTLHRPPASEWLAISSASLAQPSGIGTTRSAIFDQQGRIGTALQTLYVAKPSAGRSPMDEPTS